MLPKKTASAQKLERTAQKPGIMEDIESSEHDEDREEEEDENPLAGLTPMFPTQTTVRPDS